MVTSDLQRLNDVLADTPFAGRYRAMGGFLLGWAREGALLEHDLRDFDFAYGEEDDDRFAAAIPALERAGFRRLFRYRSRDGEYTEHSFRRRGAKYEFFRLTHRGAQDRYHVYGIDPDDPTRHLELLCEVPAQPLEAFEHVGRIWLKPRDHEAELQEMYGEWRIPDPAWSFFDEGTIVDRHVWPESDYRWR